MFRLKTFIWNDMKREGFPPQKSAQWFIILLENTLQFWEDITTVFILSWKTAELQRCKPYSKNMPLHIFDKSGWVTPTVFALPFQCKMFLIEPGFSGDRLLIYGYPFIKSVSSSKVQKASTEFSPTHTAMSFYKKSIYFKVFFRFGDWST